MWLSGVIYGITIINLKLYNNFNNWLIGYSLSIIIVLLALGLEFNMFPWNLIPDENSKYRRRMIGSKMIKEEKEEGD